VLLLGTFVLAAPLLAGAQTAPPPSASARQGYHVIKQTVLGGEGNWDYVTVDPDAHRIYVPRGTHVQVLDESTQKVVADIPGMRGIHGVAIVQKANRGFVTGTIQGRCLRIRFENQPGDVEESRPVRKTATASSTIPQPTACMSRTAIR
jgi:hypothetical protein